MFGRPSALRLLVAMAMTGLGTVSVAHAEIGNINTFLQQCPTADPAYARIRQDFVIRRNGVITGTIPCTAPVSTMPIAQYTDELIVVQGLRVILYMDQGRSGHLPWTSGTMYDWMKSRIRGINLSDTTGASYCCDSFDDGGLYVVVKTQNEANRDADRSWPGIAGNIGLYAHEARHVDGFFHDSGCGIDFGCDPSYSEANLTAYGLQWWLESRWLTGFLNVGFACLDSVTRAAFANHHLTSANTTFRPRFSSSPPPILTIPANPGGVCEATTVPRAPSDVHASVVGSLLVVTWSPPTSGPAPTSYRLDFFAGAALVATVAVGAASGTVLSIPPGVVGTFTVTIVSSAGSTVSPPSSPASFTVGSVGCIGPPPPPTGLTGSITAGFARVNWNPANNATSYIVRAGSQAGASDLYNADVGNVSVVSASGLPAGFQAFVRVIAMNGCGASTPSPDFLLK